MITESRIATHPRILAIASILLLCFETMPLL
jgi:hypothetical protein